MIKSIIKDVSLYGITPFIPKIASIFVLPLITPFLTKQDYGIFGIITAYHSFMVLFYLLGLQINFVNSYYKSRGHYKWLWRQLYGFLIIWGFFYAFFLALLLYFIIPEEAIENRLTVIVLYTLPTLLFGPVSQIASSYNQLRRNVKAVVIRNVIAGFITMFLTLYFIKYLGMGYMGWIWAYFITTILTDLSWFIPANFKYNLSPIFNFKLETIKKSVKIGLPVVPHLNALFLLNQSDRIVMDMQNVSANQIGLYNVAYTISNLFDMIGNAFVNGINPFVNELINTKKEEKLKNILFLSQIIFFFMLLTFSCFAQEIFAFLFRNDDLNKVYQLAVLIAMSNMFKPMYIAVNCKLFYYEKTKKLSLYSFIAGALNVGLNIAFIPIWGIEAAAISTFIGFMFLTYFRFWSREFLEINDTNYYPLTWMLLSIIVCIFGYYLSSFIFLYRILIFCTLLILSWYLIRKYIHILNRL